MLKVNETKCLFQHEPCKCKCRLSEKVCNLRQKWDCGKCPCECKELDYWSSFEKGYIWNLSTCDCE